MRDKRGGKRVFCEIEKIDGSQEGLGCCGVFLLRVGDAGYSQHILLHLHRAICAGDSEQTACSAPQHTSVQQLDLEIKFMITYYLLHVLVLRLSQ